MERGSHDGGLEDRLIIQHKSENLVCRHFLEAVEGEAYSWHWVCPNGVCQYRHALPEGYVAPAPTSAPGDDAGDTPPSPPSHGSRFDDDEVRIKLFIHRTEEFHRFSAHAEQVFSKLTRILSQTGEDECRLVYVDEDGDRITVSSQKDVAEALLVHREYLWGKVDVEILRIFVMPS